MEMTPPLALILKRVRPQTSIDLKPPTHTRRLAVCLQIDVGCLDLGQFLRKDPFDRHMGLGPGTQDCCRVDGRRRSSGGSQRWGQLGGEHGRSSRLGVARTVPRRRGEHRGNVVNRARAWWPCKRLLGPRGCCWLQGLRLACVVVVVVLHRCGLSGRELDSCRLKHGLELVPRCVCVVHRRFVVDCRNIVVSVALGAEERRTRPVALVIQFVQPAVLCFDLSWECDLRRLHCIAELVECGLGPLELFRLQHLGRRPKHNLRPWNHRPNLDRQAFPRVYSIHPTAHCGLCAFASPTVDLPAVRVTDERFAGALGATGCRGRIRGDEPLPCRFFLPSAPPQEERPDIGSLDPRSQERHRQRLVGVRGGLLTRPTGCQLWFGGLAKGVVFREGSPMRHVGVGWHFRVGHTTLGDRADREVRLPAELWEALNFRRRNHLDSKDVPSILYHRGDRRWSRGRELVTVHREDHVPCSESGSLGRRVNPHPLDKYSPACVRLLDRKPKRCGKIVADHVHCHDVG
eukprot:m.356269 g.356269  ORF g.356269 m.356269 type:complete len:516 (-) comp28019_c0_seq3:519-2066(-)